MNPYRQAVTARAPFVSKVRLKSRLDVREVAAFVLAIAALIGVLSFVGGCTEAQRRTARDVLSVVTVACIIANHNLPDDRVQKVCGVADALIPAMREVLGSSRAAAAKEAADAAASAKAECR